MAFLLSLISLSQVELVPVAMLRVLATSLIEYPFSRSLTALFFVSILCAIVMYPL